MITALLIVIILLLVVFYTLKNASLPEKFQNTGTRISRGI